MQIPPTKPTYESGEFSIPSSWSHFKRSAVVFDETLHLFDFAEQDISDTTFDLRRLSKPGGDGSGTDGIDTDALKNPANWSTGTVRTGFAGLAGGCAVATPDGISVFYAPLGAGGLEFSRQFRALRYSVGSAQNGTWSPDIALLQPDGTPLPVLNPWEPDYVRVGPVSATPFGSSQVIFAAIAGSWSSPDKGSILLGVYDTANVNASANTWAAQSMVEIHFSDLAFVDAAGLSPGHAEPGYRFVGNRIEVEWFTTVGGGEGADAGEVEHYLALFLTPLGAGDPAFEGASARLFVPLAVSEVGTEAQVSVVAAPGTAFTCYLERVLVGESTPIRDPAGRLKTSIYRTAPQQISQDQVSRYYDTSQPPSIQNLGCSPSLRTMPLSVADRSLPPATVFYVFQQGQTRTTRGDAKSVDYPVLEFTFSGGATACQLNLFGVIEVLQSTLQPQPADGSDRVAVISGIIDGPIPLPLVNYQGAAEDADGGTLTYGTTTAASNERQVSNAWTVGFESSGRTTKGIGPAWDVSLKSGMGTVTGNAQTKTRSFAMRQRALFEAARRAEAARISPYGTIQQVSVNLNVTAYRFLDATGRLISDATTDQPGTAPKMATALTDMVEPRIRSYTPFTVVPGDLTTYTPEAWNARMKSLGYPDDNYFGSVICANAYPFISPEEPFLSFTWTEGSTSAGGFTQFTSAFTESSWNLDTSVYAGVSVGVGFGMFGLGEEATAEFLAGTSFDHESTSKENHEAQWGVSLEDDWGPPTSDEPASVKHYEFRVYYLPVPKAPSLLPPSYWTQEMKDHLGSDSDTSGASLDPGSGAWRIVYIVTAIEYRDPTIPSFHYDGSLDKPSSYASDGG